jgi:formylglycine-generating enzyme required for sulfatase activity
VIAFTSERDGSLEVYLMNADGSGVRRLTNHPRDDYWATWSPDGRRIAFASDREGDYGIYIMNADGSGLQRLTHNDASDLEPDWSPDGSQIAFMVHRAGQSAIYVMNTDGSDRRKLTDGDGDDWLPRWSPDGSQIAFVSERDGQPEIYIMDADGSNQQRLTDHDGDDLYPAWSPDGTRISFASERDRHRELFVLSVPDGTDTDGSNPRQLTHDEASVWVSAWSPDGTRIAFTSSRDGNREIYVLDVVEALQGADGGNVRRLTDNHVLDGIPAWRPTAIVTAPVIPASDAPTTWTRPTDGMVMVYVPAGEFLMGSTDAEIEEALARCRQSYRYCNLDFYGREAPQHSVTLDSFWLDQTEVTNAQYRRCVEAGACLIPATCMEGEPSFSDTSKAEHPVVCVNWHYARTYCTWAGARLPTEAEWEYAARGPEGYLYPWGNEPGGAWQNYCDANCSESWADEPVDDGYAQTSPVDSYPEGASWCGVQDLAGNVYEWVMDWMGSYKSAAQRNPTGPETGDEKVLRGSSWLSFWDRARGATRDFVNHGSRADHIGFRCALPVED